ncbi:MAG: N-acetylmuramoyl-L-alanine amidase [Lachnospiraceae bacterium]|nr:N-acetylmuramoyl-L-alanine amidase [Lachnospiraceae bacterium]
MKNKLFRAIISALCFVVIFLPVSMAKAATTDSLKPITLIIDGVETAYEGIVGEFSFNGEKINIKKTPTYLFNDTAFINVKKIIKKAIPDAKYSYNKNTGRIKISRGDCSIVFYTDTMVVYLNGKATYSRLMPKFIEQNGDSGNFYLPGRLVFETLGYSYVWDSEKNVSVVTETNATGKIYELYRSEIVLENDINDRLEDIYEVFSLDLPKGVTKEDVSISDDIYKNEIYITVKGDHRKYFKNITFDDECKNCIVQIRSEYRLEDDITVLTILTQTDKKGICLLHTDEISDKKVFITFERAGDIYDKIVILDAGHGANDPGTQNFGINEKDCNLIIIKMVGKILEDAGIKVFYTRTDDTLISLRDRAYLGERLDADMFVSVHHNANNSRETNGTSVYYSLFNYCSSLDNTVTSRIMAETMQADLINNLKTNDMEVLTTDFTVTKYNTVPAVLVELSFLSNPDECALSITDDFRITASRTLANSILKFYEK